MAHISYDELSRKAIANVDAVFNTPGQQGNAGNTSHHHIPYEELSRRAIANADAVFNTSGQQGNAGNTSHKSPSIASYKGQPPEAEGTPFYGRIQAGGQR